MELTKKELTKDLFLNITGYSEEKYNELTPKDIARTWKDIQDFLLYDEELKNINKKDFIRLCIKK
jgi:hypothetical protein